MSTLKFRVWDIGKKTFWGDKESLEVSITISGRPLFWTGDNCRFEGKFWPPEWIVQQWTGLFDKNGKEVYEGDIIKSYNVTYEPTAVICYAEHRASFVPCEIDQYILGTRDGDPFNEAGYPWLLSQCEVIGNIFENPELLNAAKS